MMDKMKDMKTKKRTLKKEEKKESETEYVIRAENVDYTYEGSKIKALDHLSLNIRKGKKVAVMGGNGCGKSTFFLCLNGIRRPESGRIFIDGKPIEYTKKGLLDVRRKVGIVFQNPSDRLFGSFFIRPHVQYPERDFLINTCRKKLFIRILKYDPDFSSDI